MFSLEFIVKIQSSKLLLKCINFGWIDKLKVNLARLRKYIILYKGKKPFLSNQQYEKNHLRLLIIHRQTSISFKVLLIVILVQCWFLFFILEQDRNEDTGEENNEEEDDDSEPELSAALRKKLAKVRFYIHNNQKSWVWILVWAL